MARGNYAPQAYHDFIGFEVSKPVLERAFEEIYGFPIKLLFKDFDLSLGTYRRSASRIIPEKIHCSTTMLAQPGTRIFVKSAR